MNCPHCDVTMDRDDEHGVYRCDDCSEQIDTPERAAEAAYYGQLYRGLQHAPGYIRGTYDHV